MVAYDLTETLEDKEAMVGELMGRKTSVDGAANTMLRELWMEVR
jgi:hypothetical protein